MMLSVVIPARNEEAHLPQTVTGMARALAARAIAHEIVVVNDHSTDRTDAVVAALRAQWPQVRLVSNSGVPGFGSAVHYGLTQAQGDALVVVMADGSDSPADVVTYYETLQQGVDCVFGSRFMRGARVTGYPLHKLLLNRLANLFIQLLFGIRYNDVTNAFKCYRRTVIDGIQPIVSRQFNITVELPLKAIVRGYSYAVVPTAWTQRTHGMSKLKIREMGSRYLYIVLSVLLERHLSLRDYARAPRPSAAPMRRTGAVRVFRDRATFTYPDYTRAIQRKLWEVVPKEMVRLGIFGTAQTRRYVAERLGAIPQRVVRALAGRRPIWLHANSYGEVLAARPLIRALRLRYPDVPVVISTTNLTADEEAHQIPEAAGAIFMPYDSPRIVERMLRRLRPRALLFVEADLWPNMIRACRQQGIGLAVVSGRYMNLRYWFHERFPLTDEVLEQVDIFCMQSEEDVARMRRLAPRARFEVTGNLKMDSLRAEAPLQDGGRWRERFEINGRPLWIAGSIHPGEDEVVIDAYERARRDCPELLLLLAPRYPEHAERCEQLATARGLRVFRRSGLEHGARRTDESVILLDTLGELRRCYAAGMVAFVGGSLVPESWAVPGFECEGHNPLEPVLSGTAVLFGPRMGNFSALAKACLDFGLGWRVESATQLGQRVVELVQNATLRADVEQRSQRFWAQQPSVVDATIEAIADVVKERG